MTNSPSKQRIVVVGDHPSLHLGYSTIGSRVATHLHQSGRWVVQYVGRYPRAQKGRTEEPYPVFDVHLDGEGEHDPGSCLDTLLGSLLGETGVSERPLVLSIGSPRDQRLLLERLDELELRAHLRVVSYMPVDFTPLPAQAAELFRRIDVLVPYTAFGARVVRSTCQGWPLPRVSSPIPHGVDLETFHPPQPELRRQIRAERFDVGDGDLLIGFFGRNSAHKHPDLALRIFAAFRKGSFVVCESCERVTVVELDCLGALGDPPAVCPGCRSERLVPGSGHENARLYLHTELPDRRERLYAGGWDLESICRRLDVEASVIFDRSLRAGEGVSAAELARRMAACDVHLLPYDAGGWELTVLETAACGVPNVITDTAAPPEYAAPFSEVVSPAIRLPGPVGDREIIDLGLAVAALVRLASDPSYREEKGRRGVDVAASHSWQSVGRSWDHLLWAIANGSWEGVSPT